MNRLHEMHILHIDVSRLVEELLKHFSAWVHAREMQWGDIHLGGSLLSDRGSVDLLSQLVKLQDIEMKLVEAEAFVLDEVCKSPNCELSISRK